MKIIITESQYKKISGNKVLLEQYNPDRLYSKEHIVRVLKNAPRNLKSYIKSLDNIPCIGPNGESTICTKIPEIVYVYMTGRY